MVMKESQVGIDGVRFSVFPYDHWHDRYQQYYQEGLRAYLGRGTKVEPISNASFPRALRGLARLRDSYTLERILGGLFPATSAALTAIARYCDSTAKPIAQLVGDYDFRLSDGRAFRVCIDTHDSGDVTSERLAVEADLYIKTNYWPNKAYGANVAPFYNGNPLVLPHVWALKGKRGAAPEYDLCFVVRVWGGREERDGREHCLRLLEGASQVGGRKFLLALLTAEATPQIIERLRARAIPWTSRPLRLHRLWDITARSRVNVIRLGMHQCIPWRMCDLLALGACPVLDQAPRTVWPTPLEEGRHYVSLGVETSLAQPLAPQQSYDAVPTLLDAILSKGREIDGVRRETAHYFDENLAPRQVGRQICDMVLARAGSSEQGGLNR